MQLQESGFNLVKDQAGMNPVAESFCRFNCNPQQNHLIDLKTLKALSKTINDWIILPSEGKSGGILVGYNKDKFELLNKWILNFSITLLIRNKTDGYIWMFTTVYGPTLLNLRNDFWNELNNIRTFFDVAWIIGGDFNVVRYRSERKGKFFNHSVSSKFNF
jgi:hypothetical protein